MLLIASICPVFWPLMQAQLVNTAFFAVCHCLCAHKATRPMNNDNNNNNHNRDSDNHPYGIAGLRSSTSKPILVEGSILRFDAKLMLLFASCEEGSMSCRPL